MKNKCEKTRILMCGSRLDVRGGIVSVVRNQLQYSPWEPYAITYIPTHIESSKPILLLYFIQAYVRILCRALTGRYQIAYFHTAERGSFFRKAILLRSLKKMGLKTIMHHHAAEFEAFYAKLSPAKKKFVKDTLEMADMNIVLSNRLTGMILEKAPNARVKVLYNAVKTYEENPYNPNGRKILFLGRLGERKGTYDLLKAIRSLDDRLSADVQFCLCGDGEVEKVKEIIREYGIQHRIAHVGWVDGSQKAAFMAETMINVLPSYNEGLPMTVLETMAYGIPNISTNIASIPEVIDDGVSGILMEPGDGEKLEQSILKLAQDEALRLQMSQRAWEKITGAFSLDVHITTLKRFLHELCAKEN